MSLRFRFILITTLLMATGFFGFTKWILGELVPRYLEAVEEVMVDHAHLIASMISVELEEGKFELIKFDQIIDHLNDRKINAKIYQFTKTKIDTRIYLTDEKGIILFDSYQIAKPGEDYSKWNDVYLTLHDEYGARTTQKVPGDLTSTVLYVSAPILVDGKIKGVVSIGKSTSAIYNFVSSTRPQYLIAGGISILSLLLLSLIFSKWVTYPINQLRDYAQKVSQGDRETLPKINTPDLEGLAIDFYQMKQSLEGKNYIEQYIENLTHEMKSPLTAIIGAVELLEYDLDKNKKEKLIQNISNQTLRLKNLIERVLHLSKLEKLDHLEKTEKIDLKIIIKEVIDHYHTLIITKKINFELHLEDQLIMIGNHFLIHQLIDNLIKNAIEFSPSHSLIMIHLIQEDDKIKLVIMDQGTGIPEYAIDKVFDKFYSLPRPDSKEKSTGLGLSFVKEIIDLHQAKIRLTNLAQGLKVEIYF